MELRRNTLLVTGMLLMIIFAFTCQAHAKEYKLGLSLAITGPTSDAGNPYSKGELQAL